MNEEDKLRQQADTKRREADQLEREKASLTDKHQANVDAYEKQAQDLRDRADLERDLLAKDEASYNDRIAGLKTTKLTATMMKPPRPPKGPKTAAKPQS